MSETEDSRDVVEPYTQIETPYVSFCAVCENAIIDRNQAVSLITIVEGWMVFEPGMPFTVDFWIAAGLRRIPNEKNLYAVRYEIIREADDKVIFSKVHEVKGGTKSADLLTKLPQFTFEHYGPYRFSVILENRELGRATFDLIDGGTMQPSD